MLPVAAFPAMASSTASSATFVFGGRGFVGATVCRELARRGVPVLSLGRSDKPGAGGDLGPGVEHRAGVDALQPETFRDMLAGAHAVVIAIGEPPWVERTSGSKDRAIQMNGLANVAVLRAAAAQKVPRVVLVNATMPSWSLIDGYRTGKEMAEAEAKLYPETSGLGPDACSVLILKPSVITGTRYVGNIPLPLTVVFGPVRLIMRGLAGPCAWVERQLPSLFGSLLRPPVWVEEMATATANTITSKSLHGVRVLEADALVGYSAT